MLRVGKMEPKSQKKFLHTRWDDYDADCEQIPLHAVDEVDASFHSFNSPTLTRKSVDETDATPEDLDYTYLDGAVAVFSILSFLFDVGSDIFCAIIYYRAGFWGYFGMTVGFITVPSLTMSIMSLRWYLMDYRHHKKKRPKVKIIPRWKWVLRAILLMLQLGQILRYIDSLIFGIKSRHVSINEERRKKKYLYKQMLYEDADGTLLRLFECFMEAAPQLVLQLYILTTEDADVTDTFIIVIQVASVLSSLTSLAWSLTAYHKALRFTRDDKNNLSYIAILEWYIQPFQNEENTLTEVPAHNGIETAGSKHALDKNRGPGYCQERIDPVDYSDCNSVPDTVVYGTGSIAGTSAYEMGIGNPAMGSHGFDSNSKAKNFGTKGQIGNCNKITSV
ncbi:unnamed protein product [Owenia fusiformis]|uniref:XK-related protein n=1 Tax=Owenia fusiformis TaxID=6347 RepID=A0A8S4N003_OWEFU|nr:unnamed protein product [Owenia fusiformis]